MKYISEHKNLKELSRCARTDLKATLRGFLQCILLLLLSSCVYHRMNISEDTGTNNQGIEYHVKILTDTTYLTDRDKRILNLDSLDYE